MTLDELRASGSAVVAISDTAELLKIDPRTVLRAAERGELPSIKVGRRVLILREPLLTRLGA
jgi:excisionase family DNA binding protein